MAKLYSPLLFESDNPSHLGQTLAALCRQTPLYYDQGRKFWVMLRHADIRAAVRNTEVFSNLVYRDGPVGKTFVAMDGEDHARHRRIFARAFAPRSVQQYEEHVLIPTAREVVDRIAEKGRTAPETIDLIDDFCLPMPLGVIGRLIGLQPEDLDPCRDWVTDMINWNLAFQDPRAVAVGKQALADLSVYLGPSVERQIRDPGPHILGEIIRGYAEEGAVDVERIVNIAVGLVLGGYETTTWMLACAIATLLLHPEALRRVLLDRSLLMPAVEESMRWANSAIGPPRLVRKEVTVGDVTVPAGSMLLLCTAAAHYDPQVYPHPEVFDIDRRPEHLLFLPGPHHCLGAPLARMEARIGLGELFDRFPALRLDPRKRLTFVLGVRGSAMHGPVHLPVLLDEVPAERAAPMQEAA